MRTRIKICCISSVDEAKMAIEFGADAVGLVGSMPSGPGVIDDELILKISKSVPPPVATFLLTSEQSAEAIIKYHARTQTNTIQIVDKLTEGTYKDIREALPNVKLVQVIHVLDESSIEDSISVADHVDALLLDSGNPFLETKILGGTGQTHNWELSRIIIENVTIPVFLAGGLTPENIGRAINTVRPYGVDICSGVRTNGRLDGFKLAKFVMAVNR